MSAVQVISAITQELGSELATRDESYRLGIQVALDIAVANFTWDVWLQPVNEGEFAWHFRKLATTGAEAAEAAKLTAQQAGLDVSLYSVSVSQA